MDSQENELKKQTSTTAEETAADVAAAADGDLPANLPEAYRKVLAEKQELFDRLLRKQAELENTRKRLEREREDYLHHAAAELIRSLLPTLDSLERALRVRNKDVPKEFYQGLELIHRDLLDVLSRAGMKEVSTEGQDFDPHFHQAIETVESERHRDQEIVEELQKGYVFRKRLLRPAIVKVAVGKEDQSSENDKAKKSGQ